MIEVPEAPHHHHHATGIRWFDLIMPLAILAISIASLLTASQSERSMKALVEQNRRLVSAQSTPLLMLDTANLDKGKSVISMTLSNVGTGPAEIGWFHVSSPQGQDFSGGALWERVHQTDPHAAFTSQQISGTMMRSGDDRLVFSWPQPKGNSAALAAWENLNTARFKLRASACYCSMFNECKVTDFRDSQPRPVASCS